METNLNQRLAAVLDKHPEEWRTVSVNEFYEVSDLGNVRRRSCAPGRVSGRSMAGVYNKAGYHVVSLRGAGRTKKSFLAHRLVAAAFLENPEDKPHVNHIDGNKANNALSNLEWCTRRENTIHAMKLGLHTFGERNGTAKLTEEKVREIRRRYASGELMRQLAASYGVAESTVRKVVRLLKWKCVEQHSRTHDADAKGGANGA